MNDAHFRHWFSTIYVDPIGLVSHDVWNGLGDLNTSDMDMETAISAKMTNAVTDFIGSQMFKQLILCAKGRLLRHQIDELQRLYLKLHMHTIKIIWGKKYRLSALNDHRGNITPLGVHHLICASQRRILSAILIHFDI